MTSTPTIADWDVPERLQVGLWGPLGVPLLGAGLVGAALAATGVPIVGAAAAILLAGAYLGWTLGRGRAVLRSLGARPVTGGEEPRAVNLVAGKAGDIGIPPPDLWVLPREEPNALVVWSRGPHIVVTRGLLDSFTLSELEAVIAHCLVRHATGESKRATFAAFGGVRVGPALDVRAAASTRYPPALATAIRKCDLQSGPLAPLWFVARGPSHASQEERAEALLDL